MTFTTSYRNESARMSVAPHVGSRWRLPSGSIVEVLTVQSADVVNCSYLKVGLKVEPCISNYAAKKGVALTFGFLLSHGVEQ